ncbi:MAG: FHA domain-containing protein [Anaerolineaceae bacterium]|nr:FHA domain-containing protein [Anaerolineaceae bacterium]
MAESIYQFVMSAGPTPGKVFPLEKKEIFIGRDLTNDIVINDAEISRRHARLVQQAEGFVLEDLGSTNGSFVNGQRLTTPYVLQPNETVTFGENVTLAYEISKFDPDATVVSTPAASPVMPPPPQQVPVRVPEPAPIPVVPPSSYAGRIPSGPIAVEPAPPPKRRGMPIWMLILIVLIVLCLCTLSVGAYLIDRNSLWCQFFPFIPGCGA